MKSPPLGPGGEDITWPDQVAPRPRKASRTRKLKPQTSTLKPAKLSSSRQGFIETPQSCIHRARALCRQTDVFSPRPLLGAAKLMVVRVASRLWTMCCS